MMASVMKLLVQVAMFVVVAKWEAIMMVLMAMLEVLEVYTEY